MNVLELPGFVGWFPWPRVLGGGTARFRRIEAFRQTSAGAFERRDRRRFC